MRQHARISSTLGGLRRRSRSITAAVVTVAAIAVAIPALAAATTTNYCVGGLGPMAVCNQGHDHPIVQNWVGNTSQDLSCETIKSGGADSSPNIFSWECSGGTHYANYNGAQPAYAAVYNKTTGNRNMTGTMVY
jgi:hypothetical protein